MTMLSIITKHSVIHAMLLKRIRTIQTSEGSMINTTVEILECLFCKIDKKRIIAESNLAYAIQDKYPVSTGHTLIIPKRHFPDYFDITQPEINAINTLLSQIKEKLQSKDNSISAFNIGINSGPDAGQTIFHSHIHLIPRRKNDVTQPIGGVRNIIPGKGNYKI